MVLVFVLRRLGQALPVVLLASILVFAIVHLLPGDPALRLAGPDADPATLEAVRERFGLNEPLAVQYGQWLVRTASGDLGSSFVSSLPVSRLIGQAFPATLELAVATLLVVVLVAVPLGLGAAISENSPFDRVVTGFAAFLIGVPNFWLAILLILLFSVTLNWLPPSGRLPLLQDFGLGVRFLALPVLALAPRLASVLLLFVRSSSLDTLSEDYVRTARAKGLPMRIVAVKHVLRNAMLPILTVLSVQFAQLLSGAVVIETIFAWPGMGRLLITAVENQDYPLIQSTLLIFVVLFIFVNVTTDVLYGLADPRIRIS